MEYIMSWINQCKIAEAESKCRHISLRQSQVRLQKAQQQNKEEAFQDGDFTQKAHQYLSSSNALENRYGCRRQS